MINQTKIIEVLAQTVNNDPSWEVRKTIATTLKRFLTGTNEEVRIQISQSLARFEREYEIYQQDLLDDDNGC